MLSVKLYKNIEEIDFGGADYDVICPGPKVADNFRAQAHKLTGIGETHAYTIKKFTSDILVKSKMEVDVLRKSELLMHLGTIWKKAGPELGFEFFMQSFELFTDLRSYSLSLELIQDSFQYFDPRFEKVLKIFWLYLEGDNISDEQKSYQLVKEALLGEQLVFEEERKFIFWGFSHLNGTQIDILNELSKKYEVIIPFNLNTYQHTLSTDWIRWIEDNDIGQLDLEKIKLDILYYPKNRLAETIKKVFSDGDKILLTLKAPEWNHYEEVNVGRLNYKSEAEIFPFVVGSVFAKIEKSQITSCEELSLFCLEQARIKIRDGEVREGKSFKLCYDFFNTYLELSDENKELGFFDFKLARTVVNLNLPRNYVLPLEKERVDIIYSFESIAEISGEERVVVCSSSNQGKLLTGNHKYTQELFQFLSSIAPIRRAELEFYDNKEDLLNLFKARECLLLIESGTEEVDRGWSEILSHVDEREVYIDESLKKVNSQQFEKLKCANLEKKSATKLQSYVDCPQKYYFEYVEKVNSFCEVKVELSSRELGILEHNILEKYLLRHNEVNRKKLYALVEETLDDYLSKHLKEVRGIDKIRYHQELYYFSLNGLIFLYSLKLGYPEVAFSFEVALNSPGVTGSVDCVVYFETFYGIIDFKRSSASIPAKKEILSYEKIQLHFYQKYLKEEKRDLAFVGYLGLKNTDDSLFLYFNDEVKKKISALQKVKGNDLLDEASLSISYGEHESKLIERMSKDREFAPKPRAKGTCRYCVIKNICLKEER